jgi:hypothetical protein
VPDQAQAPESPTVFLRNAFSAEPPQCSIFPLPREPKLLCPFQINKPKRTASWHHHRQAVAAFVLMASLFQKYGLAAPKLSERASQLMEERWNNKKSAIEVSRQPISAELEAEIRIPYIPGLDKLDADQQKVFNVELRWVHKIAKEAAQGLVEQQRQRGMYVDLDGDIVTSSPASVSRQEAYYWIRVCERVLRLLKHGDFREPYGELAAMFEAMPKPLPPVEELMKMLGGMQSDAAEAMADL